jgi:hypothetical protein
VAGKLVEFPRKLEWKWVDTCIGSVASTDLHARVEGIPGHPKGHVRWQAFKGALLLGFGEADDHDAGMEAARKCIEGSVMVVRPT